ncbi:cytochrome c [Paenibacillus lautus]|jgi:cytochrome c551|uniref:c-type cytochrome n=1 Tax=Paenibacillus lautus TaxID=1401 RepID=UPI0026F35B34|nr:cytochrome c [Paenibacillus lautus]MCI1777827.1 cytochrome c [Paenibacillus lautus]
MFKKGLLFVVLLTTFAFAAVACGGNDTSEPAPAPAENGGQAPEEGATGGDATNDEAMTLYNANCMACHATDLAGGGNFPSLQNVGSKYDASEIAGIISNGRNGMPAFQGRLTEDEINVLSQWLAAKK